MNDLEVEATESFTVLGAVVPNSQADFLPGQSSVQVNIIDNDGKKSGTSWPEVGSC